MTESRRRDTVWPSPLPEGEQLFFQVSLCERFGTAEGRSVTEFQLTGLSDRKEAGITCWFGLADFATVMKSPNLPCCRPGPRFAALDLG